MSNSVLLHANSPKPGAAATGWLVKAALVVWLALVFALGAAGVFPTPRSTPPFPILIALVTPVIVFIAAFRFAPAFRELVLTADLRFLTILQAWRFAGFAFLALYTYAILPGYFALPAGLGDMAIGVTAPWVLAALNRRPKFAASKTFVAWNWFGLLDLIVAVSDGAFGPRFLAGGSAGASQTSAMAHLPLVLVPAYFVPLYLMLHMTALFQARRERSRV